MAPDEVQSRSARIEVPLRFIHRPSTRAPGSRIVLFLHGYVDTGPSFLRRALGENRDHDFDVLAPNGPFPVPVRGERAFKEAYSWYFIDSSTNTALITPEPALGVLASLLQDLGYANTPLVIAGFSQGGFLAPLLAERMPNCKKIVCVGSAFKPESYEKPSHFRVDAIHGVDDDVISLERSQSSFNDLVARGFRGEYFAVPDLKHTMNDEARKILAQSIDKAW